MFCLSHFVRPQQVRELSLKPHTLPSIFRAGCAALGAKSAAQQLAEVQSTEAFGQFVKVVSAKGYFKGVEEGSEGYDERMAKLVAKFRARTEAASGGPAVEEAGSTPRSAPAPAAAATAAAAAAGRAAAAPSTGAKAADEKKAEEVKGEGNKLLLAKDYEGAERCYTEALDLSPSGPNSHVYLCNRAAALCYMGRNDDAVVDCQEAIDLNPAYAKAYTRLGYAYFQVGWDGMRCVALQRNTGLFLLRPLCGPHRRKLTRALLQGRPPLLLSLQDAPHFLMASFLGFTGEFVLHAGGFVLRADQRPSVFDRLVPDFRRMVFSGVWHCAVGPAHRIVCVTNDFLCCMASCCHILFESMSLPPPCCVHFPVA